MSFMAVAKLLVVKTQALVNKGEKKPEDEWRTGSSPPLTCEAIL
jgi:hypothetical protein